MRVFLYIWHALRIVHASLGLAREAAGLIASFLVFRLYEPAGAYLDAHGFHGWPAVPSVWPSNQLHCARWNCSYE